MKQNTTSSFSSTWSESYEEFDKRGLKRYLRFLKYLEISGKCIYISLITIMFVMTLFCLLTKDFEKIIFTDGSELTCLYDNKTNSIVSISNFKEY